MASRATAQGFGVDERQALLTAGYDVGGERQPTQPIVGAPTGDAVSADEVHYRYQRPPALSGQEWNRLKRQMK